MDVRQAENWIRELLDIIEELKAYAGEPLYRDQPHWENAILRADMAKAALKDKGLLA